MTAFEDSAQSVELWQESCEKFLETVDPSRTLYEDSIFKVKEIIAHLVLWQAEDIDNLLLFSDEPGYQSHYSLETKQIDEILDAMSQRLRSVWECRELLRAALVDQLARGSIRN